MKILELHGRFFKVSNEIDSLEDALQKPAVETIQEEISEDELMDKATMKA